MKPKDKIAAIRKELAALDKKEAQLAADQAADPATAHTDFAYASHRRAVARQRADCHGRLAEAHERAGGEVAMREAEDTATAGWGIFRQREREAEKARRTLFGGRRS